MPNMKRWNAAKLEKEIYFANACDDGGPECLAWNIALSVEANRRGLIGYSVNRTVAE